LNSRCCQRLSVQIGGICNLNSSHEINDLILSKSVFIFGTHITLVEQSRLAHSASGACACGYAQGFQPPAYADLSDRLIRRHSTFLPRFSYLGAIRAKSRPKRDIILRTGTPSSAAAKLCGMWNVSISRFFSRSGVRLLHPDLYLDEYRPGRIPTLCPVFVSPALVSDTAQTAATMRCTMTDYLSDHNRSPYFALE